MISDVELEVLIAARTDEGIAPLDVVEERPGRWVARFDDEEVASAHSMPEALARAARRIRDLADTLDLGHRWSGARCLGCGARRAWLHLSTAPCPRPV